MNLDDAFEKLANSPFRQRFHLSRKLRDYVHEKGLDTIRQHATELIRIKLAPACPVNDGKQTPMKGHPVFIAQHATATCCRGCLNKWWHVPLNVELSPLQQEKIVNFIMSWIERDMATERKEEQMKCIEFGVCLSPAESKKVAGVGFDYIEGNVQGDLVPMKSDLEFQEHFDMIKGSALPVKCANCFLPGTLKVVGPDVDMTKAVEYAEIAFARAQMVGIDTIVFGSGGARQIPDGFSEEWAVEQVYQFTKNIAPLAKKYNVTLVVEPLCDCNILNSVAEGAALVTRVKSTNVRLLADFYHWDADCDRNIRSLIWSVPLLRHIHIATTPNRNQPGTEDCNMATFFRILKNNGYKGRISFEGHWKDMPDKERKCAQTMRDLWKNS